MAEPNRSVPQFTLRLILIPALISLAVTLLRLAGELAHWPKPLVNSAECGKAILGVTWLMPIFGIYFALALAAAGMGPKRLGQTIGYGFLGLILKLCGTLLMERSFGIAYPIRLGTNFVLTLTGVVLLANAWPALFKALFTYGYTARIPVAIVQYFAMRGNWGTHYDALDPAFPLMSFWAKYIRVSLVGNVFFAEAYTVIVGSIFGGLALFLLGRSRKTPQSALAG